MHFETGLCVSACKCAVLGYGWNYVRIYGGVRGEEGRGAQRGPWGKLKHKKGTIF